MAARDEASWAEFIVSSDLPDAEREIEPVVNLLLAQPDAARHTAIIANAADDRKFRDRCRDAMDISPPPAAGREAPASSFASRNILLTLMKRKRARVAVIERPNHGFIAHVPACKGVTADLACVRAGRPAVGHAGGCGALGKSQRF